jgi:NADPH-dependent curcumin reductase CurA
MGMSAREVRLKQRPVGMPKASDFDVATVELPDPGPGQALVRNLWMSVDPYMRGRMVDRASYVPPFQIGEALQGGAVGQVVASNDPSLKEGDLVESFFGWREGFVAPAAALQKLPALNAPPQAFLGVLGMPGLTAYAGLLRVGEPKPGDTVMVSGAAGAVGSVVVQIAKIKGCRVIASAGTDDKVDWVRSLGADHVVNYKTCGNLLEALRAGAPDGIDVYFDNVGGDHLEAALELAKLKARIVLCGGISVYNATEPPPGPRNYMNIVGKSLRMEGFIVSNFQDMRAAFLKDMGEWIGAGKMKWEETVENGVENAPKAFLNLFTGANTGKMLVKLG